MDEPLSNLDAQLRVEMRREIRALQRRLGMTMLYVTHDQVEAMTMADQVVLMRNGRIEQDAAPAALYEQPATIFAARFVGTPPMNVIPAALGAGRSLARRADRPRARHAWRSASGPEAARSPRDGVPATVAAVEYLGADTLLDTRIARSALHRARLRPRDAHAAGDTVGIALGAVGRALVRSVVTMSYRSIKQQHQREEHMHARMDRRQFLKATAALAGSDARQARARAGRDRSLVLLSDRGRRPDHQDHRRLCGRLREGQSGDQGEADLFRHLSGNASPRR